MRIHLFQRRHRLESALGTRLLFSAARVMHRLPLGVALAFGRLLGWCIPRCFPRHFRRICIDIALAYGDAPTAPATLRLARDFYRGLGESLVEFLRLPYLSADEIRRLVRLEGTEYLDAALAEGRGAILLTAHLGNWELCGTSMGLSRYPTTAIARSQVDATLTDLFNHTREAHGLKVVGMTDLRGCIRVLKRNECLGVLNDVNANHPGAFVQFFGRPAASYTGVAYLARTTGAAILPIFDQRLPDKSHVVRIYPPIPVVRTEDEKRDLLVNTMRTQHVIEQAIRRRPADWFWLLYRWRTRPEEVPHPDRIPMEHRDLTTEEAARLRDFSGGFDLP